MCREEAPCRFAVAGLERGKNGRMFLNGIAPAPLRTERQIAGALCPRQQCLVRLAQRGIPRRSHDQPMNLAIDGEIIVELAVPVMVLHARLQKAQALQFAFGGALGCKFSREALDTGERFEQLKYAICVDLGDPRAAVRS